MLRGLLCGLFLLTSTVHGENLENNCRRRLFDLIFVLDGSKSVQEHNFNVIKNYVKSFVDQYHVDPGWTRVAVIQYGSIIKEEISLGEYQDKTSLKAAIDDIEFMCGGTMTGKALKHVALELLGPRSHVDEGHKTTTKVVLLTDGRSQDSGLGTVSKYQRVIKDSGAKLYVVAVGSSVNATELEEIASKPTSKYLHRYDEFGSIRLEALHIGDDVECDVDECLLGTHECEQVCVNTFGGYECACNEPERFYVSYKDGTSCHAKLVPPPVNLRFSSLRVTSAVAEWELPSTEIRRYLDVAGYNISYRKSDKRGGWKHKTVATMKIDLSKLSPNTEYDFNVYSFTEDGKTSITTSGKFKTANFARTSIILYNATSSSLTARWQAGEKREITGYKLRWKKLLKNGSADLEYKIKAKKFDSSVTRYNIENLEANTKYEAWVNPIYGNLEGKLADHFSETTTKLVPSVEDLRAENVGTKTATIKWSVSGNTDDYDVIKNFVVKYWRVGAKRRTLRRLTKKSELSLSRLREGTKYQASVSAVSQSGELSQAEIVQFNTTTSSETKLRVNKPELTSFRARWKAAYPARVTSYHMKVWEEGNEENARELKFGRNTLKTTIRYLKPATKYSVSLYPVYESGKKGDTIVKTITTAAMGKVKARQSASTITSFSLRWEVSRNKGLTGFEINYRNKSSGEKGFTTFVQKNVRDQKIENLLPDSKYDVTITPIYGDNKGVGKVLTAETDDFGDLWMTIKSNVVSIKLGWGMQDTNERDLITRYLVETFTTANPTDITTYEFSANETEFLIRKLKPDTEYEIDVTPFYDDLRGTTVYDYATTKEAGKASMMFDKNTNTLKWKTDEDEGLQEYKIIYKKKDSSSEATELVFDASTTQHTFNKLEYATEYTFEVVPRYKKYVGRSSVRSFTTRIADKIELGDIYIEQNARSNKIYWEVLKEGKGEFSNVHMFKVIIHKLDGSDTQEVVTGETSLALSELEDGKEYQLRIVAIDKNQKIMSNILSHVFTYVAWKYNSKTTTNKTESVETITTTASRIVIKFSNKSLNFEDIIEREIKITYLYKDGTTKTEVRHISSNEKELVLSNVTPNTDVHIEITDIYKDLTRGKTVKKTVKTKELETPQPSSMSVQVGDDSTNALAQWKTSVLTEEHKNVDHYNVKYWRVGSEDQAVSLTVKEPHVNIDGLEANSVYSIKVEVVTEDGQVSEPAVETFETKKRRSMEVRASSTSNSIDLTWQSDDEDVSGFEIEYSLVGEDGQVTGLPHIQKLSSDTRDFEISSLLAERIYEIKLTPYYNDLEGQTGTLRISTVAKSVTSDIRVEVTSKRATSLILELESSVKVDGYHVTYSVAEDDGSGDGSGESGAGEETTISTSSDVIIMEGLEANTNYNIKINPVVDGEVQESFEMQAKTRRLKVPRIESMSIETTSPISAWVRWKVAGTEDDNYEKVSQYSVMYHAHENRGVVIQESTEDTSFELKHLLMDHVYTVSVDGQTEGGRTLNSIRKAFKTAEAEKVDIEVMDVSKHQMLVRWSLENDQDVRKYLLSYYRLHDPTDRPMPIPIHGGTHERRLYRLRENTTYAIEVTPMFGYIAGPMSSVHITTAAYEPVEITDIFSEEDKVTLEWRVEDEGEIRNFSVLYFPSTDQDGEHRKRMTVSSSQRQLTIENLDSETEYEVHLTTHYKNGGSKSLRSYITTEYFEG